MSLSGLRSDNIYDSSLTVVLAGLLVGKAISRLLIALPTSSPARTTVNELSLVESLFRVDLPTQL